MTIQQTANRALALLIISIRATVLAVLVITAAGCASPPPQITIEGQYAELSQMFIGSGSFYMTIRNAGGRDTLIGVSAALPRTVIELHDVKDHRMVRIEKIPVPARNTVELKPGGPHIMIFNMPRTVQKGSDLVLTLRFERSGEQKVPVRFEK